MVDTSLSMPRKRDHRAQVKAVVRTIAPRELEIVRDAIQQQYGFIPPDIYIIDLIKFVDAVLAGDGQLPPIAEVAQARMDDARRKIAGGT